MRVLITGAAGFLGSHLCESLVNKGHQVIGMDNFITGSIDNLVHIAGPILSLPLVRWTMFCISPPRQVQTPLPLLVTRICPSRQ
jgi:nucleoside-diphosphate-sugar epimerase